jgi:hypothetical protein
MHNVLTVAMGHEYLLRDVTALLFAEFLVNLFIGLNHHKICLSIVQNISKIYIIIFEINEWS